MATPLFGNGSPSQIVTVSKSYSMRLQPILFCGIAILVFGIQRIVNAAVLYDDVQNSTYFHSSTVGDYPRFNWQDYEWASQFTVLGQPNGSIFRVTEYQFALSKATAETPGAPTIDFRLHDDQEGYPGRLLDVTSVTVTKDGIEGAKYSAISTEHPLVTSGGRYWILATAVDDATGVFWHHSTFVDERYVKRSGFRTTGSEWNFYGDITGPALRVDGVAVPEPSAIGLLSLGGMATLAFARRKSSLTPPAGMRGRTK